jgi:hypothetical protein
MVSKHLKATAAVAILGVLGFGASGAKAGSVIRSGSTVDGWTITYPTGISLIEDAVVGNTLQIEKEAAFVSMEGLVITFTQDAPAADAAQYISIVNENVTNLTGQSWGGFQMFLSNPEAPINAPATFVSQFNEITPFATGTLSTDVTPNDTYTLGGGGSVAPGATALWGYDPNGGDLTIDANPNANYGAQGQYPQSFGFKELPNAASVPLPASVWMGLAGLGMAGLVVQGKKAKKVIA